ncbi:reverse transcriptase domain-containing protein [Tanacetum coccineum]|uniref:Reverse transcriptase domain-containing protein n=1 Tax=Tanacetum coccineum TaxID=301880 RepID=A0ABQ4YIN7_9ASTR
MDDETMWATDRVVAPTLGSAITILETANEFAIKGNHLTRVKGNQFDGRIKTDPHKHIHEFLRIRDMFKYRDTEIKVVRLMMFPLSLTGEAKTWLDELNEGTIEMWDELQANFISQFFPQLFSINSSEKSKPFPNMKNKFLTDAWLRMKEIGSQIHAKLPGKSMSLDEATEEEEARQVHATHEWIATESDPKPARRRPSEEESEYYEEETVDKEIEWLTTNEKEEKKDNDEDDRSIDNEKNDMT